MTSDLISIIIPAYNIEDYIEKCIESLLCQTYKNLEIIVVDDGSTDDTYAIAANYAKIDSRVIVYKKNNGGVTSARKYGLENARGKYVAFVDGDDYVDSQMYYSLYEKAKTENVQVVLSQQVYIVYKEKIEILQGGLDEGSYYAEDDSIRYIREHMWNHKKRSGVLPFIWCNMYSINLAKNIMSLIPDDLIFSEDATYMYMLLSVCDSISVINKAFYYYKVREGSAVDTIDEKLLTNMGKRYEVTKAFYKNNPYNAILMKQLRLNITEDFIFHFFKAEDVSLVVFPYEKIPRGSKLILYAAGKVGNSYYKQICMNHYCKVVLWVDRNVKGTKNGFTISKPEKIRNTDYDYILIAIQNEKTSEMVCSDLCNIYGVEEEKIVTHTPNSFFDILDF